MNEKRKKIIVALAVILACLITGIINLVAINIKQAEPQETEKKGSYKTHVAENKYDDVGIMIMNCDSMSDFEEASNLRITSGTNRFVEGTGAMALEDARRNGYGILSKPVDISGYADGSVHISIYVNDTKYLNNVITFELTSSASYDFDEIAWDVETHWLQNGWNEIYLQIDKAKATGELTIKKPIGRKVKSVLLVTGDYIDGNDGNNN